MKRNAVGSEYMEKTWNSGALKTFGRRNKHRDLRGTASQGNNGAYVKGGPQLRNHIWSYHFIAMQTSDGLPLHIFTIIDEYTQECLRSTAAGHIGTQDVMDELFDLFLQRGTPNYLFAFNEDDAMPMAICEWLKELEISSTFVELKKYDENGYGALFQEKLLKALFGRKRFASLAEVQFWLENWRNDHNRSINLFRV